MTNEIVLPQKDDRGYYISYSQFSSFLSKKSFSLGIEGKLEYIRGYFFGERFPDQGWGQFGTETEGYICDKEFADNFTDREKEVMNKIKPLGVFQKEISVPLFEGIRLKGFIDDANEDLSIIRDYKTASATSKMKYYKDDYYQLPLYAKAIELETGKLPLKAEVCIIERKGNCFGMTERRDLLSIGNEIWYHEVDVSEQRVNEVIERIKATVIEISELYKVFLKVNI